MNVRGRRCSKVFCMQTVDSFEISLHNIIILSNSIVRVACCLSKLPNFMSSQRTIWKGFCRACLAERRQQQQRRFVHQDVASTSATPLPRNSPKPEDADSDLRNATALAAIRFELGQTKPALPKVWMHLKELAFSDVPPTDLTGEIIRKAEPTLQRISRPKDRLTAPLTIVAYMEEAEALYSRYRFVADRQHPSTPGTSAPMRILEWLKGFGELAYAPAAWRVWEDCRNKADEDGIVLARDISHSVILTTTKWVAFCKQYYRPREERRLLRQKIKEVNIVRMLQQQSQKLKSTAGSGERNSNNGLFEDTWSNRMAQPIIISSSDQGDGHAS